MGSPARFPFGLTTVDRTSTLGNYGLPDPTGWHEYFEDFNNYVAADWTITRIGTTPTEALADVDGGALLLTLSAADNDSDFLQKKGASFLATSGKKLFFKARFQVSDATQSDWIMGLVVVDTTPLAAAGDGTTDGIFFQKDDGDTDIDFYVQKDATTGQNTSTAIATAAAAATYMTVGFYFDGKRYVYPFVNDIARNRVDLTTTLTTYLPDAQLAVTFGVQNGEAVAKTMQVDYVFAAQER
jgi:hypothetical protein